MAGTEICQQLGPHGIAAHQECAVHTSGGARERCGIVRVADHAPNTVGPRPRLAGDRVHTNVTRAKQLDEALPTLPVAPITSTSIV